MRGPPFPVAEATWARAHSRGPMTARDRVRAQLEVDAAALGFNDVPSRLHLKVVARSRCLWAFLPAGDTSPGAVADWLAQWNPIRVEVGRRRIVRAIFERFPPEWERLARDV